MLGPGPLDPVYCRIPEWADGRSGHTPEWFDVESRRLPDWFSQAEPAVQRALPRLRLLCLLERWPRLIVPCRSLAEWEARKRHGESVGFRCTADYGLTPYLLGDGDFKRAGFCHVSRAILRKEFGQGWLPYCQQTLDYIERVSTTRVDWTLPESQAWQFRTWHLELQRELFHSAQPRRAVQDVEECRIEVAREAFEVLRVTCFGVTASVEEFESLAEQVVEEQLTYREKRIAQRNG